MAEAPPEALLPEWDVDEEEAAEERLGRYARDHLILRDAAADALEDGLYGDL